MNTLVRRNVVQVAKRDGGVMTRSAPSVVDVDVVNQGRRVVVAKAVLADRAPEFGYLAKIDALGSGGTGFQCNA